MNVSAYYRYHPGGNLKRRPPFFSKLVCLLAFVRAIDFPTEAIDVLFLVDGEPPATEGSIMERYGRIERLDGTGNARHIGRAP